MHRQPVLVRACLALSLCAAPFLVGCDADEDPATFADAETFEDGVTKDTDGGAFRIMLESREGLALGPNTLVVHVGFHDPMDPEGPGIGVPGADISLDAHMPAGAAGLDGLDATYLGEGRYLIEDLDLSEAGVWQLDLAIAVGETIDESVAFAFEIDA